MAIVPGLSPHPRPPPMPSPVISISNLSKSFRIPLRPPGVGGRLRSLLSPTYNDVSAVDGLDLTVEQGELLAFIGMNGAGKSTTLKMLTGILHPSSGEARVLGLVPWENRIPLAMEIGSVFGQKSQLWYHLPPSATFRLLGRIYAVPGKVFDERLNKLSRIFELTPLLHKPVRKLSLGERMRCEVVASLLHGPRILFLDEPTIGLDVVAKARLRERLLELNHDEGLTLFLTSHDTTDIEKLCKRAVIIDKGKIVLDTRVAALRRNYLRTKVVGLRVVSHPESVEFPGVRVLKKSPHGLKLSVDTSTASIGDVLAYLYREVGIADITITDPPLEEIIGRIFTTPSSPSE